LGTNIGQEYTDIACSGANWIHLVQDCVQGPSLLSPVLNVCVLSPRS